MGFASLNMWPIDLEIAAGRACIEHVLPGRRHEKTLSETFDALLDDLDALVKAETAAVDG